MKEFEEILTNLKRKIVKPVYYLYGDEPYYIDKISDYIEENFLDEQDREFNQTVLYGKDIDLPTLLSYAKGFPMMSDYKVVIVKEAQNISEFSKKEAGASGEDSKGSKGSSSIQHFINYLQQPLSSTVLVICQKYKAPDGRSALFKAFKKHSVCIESKKMYDSQVPGWINEFSKEIGYKINPRASQMLADYLGNDLTKIANEINKLIINIPPGSEINTEQVQENIGISKEFNVFELQDALARKDVLKSNQIINYFAANPKENPLVMVLASLYGYFNKVLQCHFVQDKNKFTIAKELGINPYFAEGYIRASANYGTMKLKQVFHFLRECDLKSKGVENDSFSHGDLLKELVFKILH